MLESEYTLGLWDVLFVLPVLNNERPFRSYMLGVYDPATSSVTLRAVPLFTVSRRIKALANLRESASSAGGDWEARVQARRELGEAFGNRKARLAVRNQDRMKVDTRNMEGIQDAITDGIDDATAQLPTAGEFATMP